MKSSEDGLEEAHIALSAIQYLLANGKLSDDLPETIKNDPLFQEFTAQLIALQQYSLSMANGDLSADLNMKGRMAGALKSLQASLRHLTYQTQRIAEGDYNQKVHFMGDFAQAFNEMVRKLREARHDSLRHLAEAQVARDEAEKANRILQDRLQEIQILQARLQEQAIRDPLTNLYNRRYLDETIDREFARALRENYPICLAMADIDHFKQVNDRFGHAKGDEVLKTISRTARQLTRAGDMVVRYGGEEILFVLTNLELAHAASRLEELREEIHDLKAYSGNEPIMVTISIGVAVFPQHGLEKDTVIACADQALYQAKNDGRNRVVVYQE